MYYQELDFWSKLWKQSDEYGFLKECPAHLIQQKLKDLERAFKDAFDKKQPNKRLPTFKRRGTDDGFRFPAPNQVQLGYNHMTFPKLGRVKFYRSQAIVGKIKNDSIRRTALHWTVSVQVETERPSSPQHQSTTAIGLDVGIKHFVSTSEGEHIAPLNAYRGLSNRLAIAQRQLSKKKKYSVNWKKQQLNIARIHHTIANARRDFLHKLSTNLSKNHAIIVVEDLQIKNMSHAAKGTIASPGKNVRAKSGLNKSILDQGWGEFRRQLDYKSDWRGGQLIAVSPKHTSQRCSRCHHVASDNRKTQESFACVRCGYEENADLNAAKNILAAGHVVLACGASA